MHPSSSVSLDHSALGWNNWGFIGNLSKNGLTKPMTRFFCNKAGYNDEDHLEPNSLS